MYSVDLTDKLSYVYTRVSRKGEEILGI